jgi:hypothetical protein
VRAIAGLGVAAKTIPRAAEVISACTESLGPHFFICNAMVANDANSFKIMLEGFNIGQCCGLQIYDNCERAIFGGAMAEFIN